MRRDIKELKANIKRAKDGNTGIPCDQVQEQEQKITNEMIKLEIALRESRSRMFSTNAAAINLSND